MRTSSVLYSAESSMAGSGLYCWVGRRELAMCLGLLLGWWGELAMCLIVLAAGKAICTKS